mgnify:FL=1
MRSREVQVFGLESSGHTPRSRTDSCWSWLVCIAGTVSVVIVVGLVSSFGLLLPIWMETFQANRQQIGNTMLHRYGSDFWIKLRVKGNFCCLTWLFVVVYLFINTPWNQNWTIKVHFISWLMFSHKPSCMALHKFPINCLFCAIFNMIVTRTKKTICIGELQLLIPYVANTFPLFSLHSMDWQSIYFLGMHPLSRWLLPHGSFWLPICGRTGFHCGNHWVYFGIVFL